MQIKHSVSPLLVIFGIIFLDLLGIGILIPVIPLLLGDPASPYYLLPAGASIGYGYILLGFLTAVFPFMQFLASPILGELSDKYGRRSILAISLAGTCLSYIMFAIGILTKNIPLLFIARAFDGITGGNVGVGQAVIADTTTPENRAKAFGMIGAAFGIGFILGPFLGGVLSDGNLISWFNAATPFWFAAILSFVNVLMVLVFLPETHPARRMDMVINWGKSVHNIIRAFGMKSTRALFSTTFLMSGGFAFFTTFFSVFLITRFSFGQSDIGNFFAYVGIWIAFTQAVITRAVAKRASEMAVVRYSLFAMGLAIFLYFLPRVGWQLMFVTPFFAIANGLTQANLTALVSRSVDQTMQGEILGINVSVQSLASAIPPVLSGFVAATLAPTASIVVSAIVILMSGFVFRMFYKPEHLYTKAEVQIME